MVEELLRGQNVKTLQEVNALSISPLNHNGHETTGPPLPFIYK